MYQILLKGSNVQVYMQRDLGKIGPVNRFGDGFPNFLHFPNLLTHSTLTVSMHMHSGLEIRLACYDCTSYLLQLFLSCALLISVDMAHNILGQSICLLTQSSEQAEAARQYETDPLSLQLPTSTAPIESS